MNLHALQIEPLLRKRLHLDIPNPKYETVRLRQLARLNAVPTIPDHPLLHHLSTATPTNDPSYIHQLNQILAQVTAETPLRFITTLSGGTPLHCLFRNPTLPPLTLARAAQLLVSLDPSCTTVFNAQRQLALHVLLTTRPSMDNALLATCQLLFQHYPAAKNIALEGLLPLDHLQQPTMELQQLFTPSQPRTSRTSIFDLVESPHYLPMASFTKYLHQYPLCVYDSTNGMFPLEALVQFGKPTPSSLLKLWALNPGACVTASGSLLHLLVGTSRSLPTLPLVQCLCSIDPTALFRKNNASLTCLKLLAKRHLKLERTRASHQKQKTPRQKQLKVIQQQQRDLVAITQYLQQGCDIYHRWQQKRAHTLPIFNVLGNRCRQGKHSKVQQQEYIGTIDTLCTQELQRTVGNSGQTLRVNALGRSPLHVMCSREDVAQHDTILCTLIQALPRKLDKCMLSVDIFDSHVFPFLSPRL
jgi:hypothetical protein